MRVLFRETKACPQDSSGWKIRERELNCSNYNPKGVYHCLKNDTGTLGEICIAGLPARVQPNYCPEYDQNNGNLNTVPCYISAGCPDVAFDSNEVYKYPVCLKGIYTSTAEVPTTTSTVDDDGASSPPWNIIAPGVAVGVIVLFVVLIVVALLCYRKRRIQQTTTQNEDHIPLLSRDIPFYKTSVFHEANKFLKDGGKILCLIGQWGSGKSTTAKQLYMSNTGRSPIVIEDILKFDMSSCQESVIVEEPLPREDLSDTEISNAVEKVFSLCEHMQKTNNTFLIITSTEEAWQTIVDKVSNCEFKKHELHCIDLNWKKLRNGEMTQILHTIFQYYNPDIPYPTKLENVVSNFNNNNVGFPEICTLFSKCSEFQEHGVIFFNRPLRYLCEHFEEMCKSSNEKDKFLLLVYMSVNNMKIDMNDSNDKLWEVFRSGGLNTDGLSLKSILPNKFVVEESPSIYVLQHEIIKRMTLMTFGKFHFSDLLKFSSRKDLVGWIKHKEKTFIPETLMDGVKQSSDKEPYLEINDEKWNEYQAKMEMTNQLEFEAK